MENVNGLHDFLASATLEALRLSSIQAQILSKEPMKGGRLEVVAKSSLLESTEDPKVISEVTLEVLGIPEGGTAASPAFRIVVTAQARFSWPEIDSEAMSKNETNFQLAKIPYAYCVTEVRQLALRLGLSNLKLPIDLMKAINGAEHVEDLRESKSKLKAPPSSTAKTVAAPKKRASRSTKSK